MLPLASNARTSASFRDTVGSSVKQKSGKRKKEEGQGSYSSCPFPHGDVSRGPSSNNDDPFHLLMDRNERHEPSESIQFRVSV